MNNYILSFIFVSYITNKLIKFPSCFQFIVEYVRQLLYCDVANWKYRINWDRKFKVVRSKFSKQLYNEKTPAQRYWNSYYSNCHQTVCKTSAKEEMALSIFSLHVTYVARYLQQTSRSRRIFWHRFKQKKCIIIVFNDCILVSHHGLITG